MIQGSIQKTIMDSGKTGLTAAAMHLAIEVGTQYLGHAVVLGSAVSTGGLAFSINAAHKIAKSALDYIPDVINRNLHLKNDFVAAVIDAALLFGLSYAAVVTLAPMVGVAVGVNVVGLWALTMASQPIANAFSIPKLPFGSEPAPVEG